MSRPPVLLVMVLLACFHKSLACRRGCKPKLLHGVRHQWMHQDPCTSECICHLSSLKTASCVESRL